jgi:hypothetical protein
MVFEAEADAAHALTVPGHIAMVPDALVVGFFGVHAD